MNRLQIRTAIKGILDDLVGTDSEQYWDKATLNTHIQEAMDEIAKRTLCIKDSLTPAFCRIDLVADQIHYPMPAGVLQVDSVNRSWDKTALKRTDHAEIEASNRLWQTCASEPRKYLTDYSSGYLSIVGRLQSVTTEALEMSVRRLPVVMTTDADVPDVPAQFHNMSYDWVLYRCFSKQDAEIHSKSLSDGYLTKFQGPPQRHGQGGNIEQIILQSRPFCAKSKVRFC